MQRDNFTSEEERKSLQYEQFLRLLMTHRQRIFGFILMLVPSRSYAQDLMQDTIMIMWRKFGEFKPGSSFAAWGITIARYNVLKFRRKQQNACVQFSSEAFEAIARRAAASDNRIDDRLKALEGCLGKLNDNDSKLIQMRYGANLTIRDIARRVGRPIHGMYKAMARIHNILHECVNRTLAAWEMP